MVELLRTATGWSLSDRPGVQRSLVATLDRHARRLLRVAGWAVLLLASGCPLHVVDHNAFQTGKVLKPGQARISTTASFVYVPYRASIDVGVCKGWEVGAGYGLTWGWGWSGDLSVTRSLYTDKHLFSSVMVQAERAQGEVRQPPLTRVTSAAAAGWWFAEECGIYVPLRLSMLFASPATFPYLERVWNDTLGHHVLEDRERAFHGLRDLVFTPGIGVAAEFRRLTGRLALNWPVIAPNVQRDSVTEGVEFLPYVGFHLGVLVF